MILLLHITPLLVVLHSKHIQSVFLIYNVVLDLLDVDLVALNELGLLLLVLILVRHLGDVDVVLQEDLGRE